MSGPRVGYVLSRYPGLSHTFIQREIEALRGEGLELETLTVRPGTGDDLLEPVNRAAAAETYVLVCASRLRLAARVAAVALRHPAASLALVVSSVRRSPPGLRPPVYRVLYALEGMVVWRWARRQRLEHLHAHFSNVASEVAELAAELGARTGRGPARWSVTIHGSLDFFEVERHRFRGKTETAAGVAVISHFTRAGLLSFARPEDWAKVRVVRCGLRPAEVPPLGPRPGDGTILTVARLEPGKGIDLLLGALATIRRTRGRGRLLVAGDGPHRPALERRTAELDLQEHVDFLGAVDQRALRELHARADVFCLPSFSEGIPVVLMEAMAYETPVVATRLMGIPELVEDGVGGTLVHPADEDDLVRGLLAVLGDPEAAAARARAGRARLEADYDVDRNAPALLGLFAGRDSW